MKKNILLSIHKKWIDKILNGDKQFEFRKMIGRFWVPGTKVLIYECKNNGGCGAVVGEFLIEDIFYQINLGNENDQYIGNRILMTEIYDDRPKCYEITPTTFINNGYEEQKFAIKIINAIKYKKPKSLSNYKCNGNVITKAPQSYCYVT